MLVPADGRFIDASSERIVLEGHRSAIAGQGGRSETVLEIPRIGGRAGRIGFRQCVAIVVISIGCSRCGREFVLVVVPVRRPILS